MRIIFTCVPLIAIEQAAGVVLRRVRPRLRLLLKLSGCNAAGSQRSIPPLSKPCCCCGREGPRTQQQLVCPLGKAPAVWRATLAAATAGIGGWTL